MSALKLVVFDVDGTLVDSQADILGAMSRAFEVEGLEAPHRDAVLSIVGLSLEVAVPKLAPTLEPVQHSRIVEGYKAAYFELRQQKGAAESSPLYPGALATLDRLGARDEVLLGVATGKSRRGLDKLLAGHGLTGRFVTEQVADHHPSKPHPAMLHAALAETGVEAQDAVMIGDTSYDMEMAQAAGLRAIGVSWGYHDRAQLAAADIIVDSYDALEGALEKFWS